MEALPSLITITKAQKIFEITERQKERVREKRKAERTAALEKLRSDRASAKRERDIEYISQKMSGMSRDKAAETEEEFRQIPQLKAMLFRIEDVTGSDWRRASAARIAEGISGCDDDTLDTCRMYFKFKGREHLSEEMFRRQEQVDAEAERILKEEEEKEELALRPKVIPGKITARVTLGLAPTGGLTVSEVKKAFYKKALELHPDKNSSPDAVKQFQFLQQQYEALLGVLE